MTKKKTPKLLTPDTSMSEVKEQTSPGHNDTEWEDFEKRAESKLPPTIEEFPKGEAVIGILESIETIENKKQGTESEALILVCPDGRRRFWGFGLLMHELEKNKVQPGMKVFIRKGEKKKMENGQPAWSCEFYAE